MSNEAPTLGRPVDIIQNGWVVPDLNTAMREWLQAGYGPFLTLRIDLPNAIYRGRTVPLNCTIALTHGGGVQIELIQQHSPGPSAYRDVFGPDEGGLHHICRISSNYSTDVEQLRGRGFVLATEAKFQGMQYCYADTRKSLGCMLEVVPDLPMVRALNQAVVDAANGWDGSEPIRVLTI